MLIMYPAMRYSRDGRTVVVQDEAESLALGPDWSPTPATWLEPAPIVPPVLPAPVKRKPGRPRKG